MTDVLRRTHIPPEGLERTCRRDLLVVEDTGGSWWTDEEDEEKCSEL